LVDDILLQAGIINKFRVSRGSQDRFLVVIQDTDMKLQAEIMAKVQAARERARRKVEKHNTQRETGKREETEKLAGGQIAKQAERRMETVFDRKQESEEANIGECHAENSESDNEDVNVSSSLALSL